VTLRLATPDDAGAMARILWDCFEVSLPFLPQLHTREDHVGYMLGVLLPQHTVWVAEVGGAVMGYIAFREGRIQHLYIHPDAQGRGLGPTLLAKALEAGGPKDLWTFQQNERARRFYEARGFEAVEFTDGAGNEEKQPDVRYLWTP
jgi:ribosomal protein S18 acetylase RimI-like enzyme